MPEIKGLYMLAIMPPPELSVLIDLKRKTFAQKYGSVAALKPPVHCTLFEPFKASVETEQKLKELHAWASQFAPFDIELSNYSFFDNPENKVVYIAVTTNRALQNLQHSVVMQVKRYVGLSSRLSGFTPHFTIAYRDLTPEKFPAVVEEYSKMTFSASFTCSSIYLWKHNGSRWEICDEYQFGSTSSFDTQMELF